MAQQAELFPEPAVVVRPSGTRGEPRLWVRRVAIWEKPGTVLRDISLRRGLNIIWSPDPGAESADVGRGDGSGHGAARPCYADCFATALVRKRSPTTISGEAWPNNCRPVWWGSKS